MTVYLLILRDKFELPVAIGDTIKELSINSGLSLSQCYKLLHKPTKKYYIELVTI